jgi:hypothetical protein
VSEERTALEEKVLGAGAGGAAVGPPRLEPFGLVLHHDGRWSHEGQPILNRKLREKFDRSVVYLPHEAKYVVRVGHFQGEIEIEEAGFFVRSLELETGEILLSDGGREPLRVETLRLSSLDGALLCQIKTEWVEGGLPTRFTQGSHAELLGAVEEQGETYCLVLSGRRVGLPRALVHEMAGPN